MVQDNEKKRKLIYSIIGVSVFVILVIGSAFAYFGIEVLNTTNRTLAKAKTEDAYIVAVEGSLEMKMNLTADQLRDQGTNITYFGDESGATTTNNAITFATFTSNEEFPVNCRYTIVLEKQSVSGFTNTINEIYTKGINNEMVLTITSDGMVISTIDMKTTTWDSQNKLNINGTLLNLVKTVPRKLDASLKLTVFSLVNQNYLANSKVNLKMSISKLECFKKPI